jgi:hypothetical protein
VRLDALARVRQSRRVQPSTAASLRVVSDVVPTGWLPGPLRDRSRNSFPASLSQTWGEAAWTSPDLWMSIPVLAALRASAAVSGLTLPADTEVRQRRTYRRLRQSAEDVRARAEQRIREADLPNTELPTPTDAMLALGTKVTAWTARVVVITFVLIVIGLGMELGVTEAIPFP